MMFVKLKRELPGKEKRALAVLPVTVACFLFKQYVDSLQHDVKCFRLDVQDLDDVFVVFRQPAEEHGLEDGGGHGQEHPMGFENLEK